MRPLSLGTYRWAVAGLATIGVADLLAINLVVGPAWIASPAFPPPSVAAAPTAPATQTASAAPATQTASTAPATRTASAAPAASPASTASAKTAEPVVATTPPTPPPQRPAPVNDASFGSVVFGTNSAVLTVEGRNTLLKVAKEMRTRHKLIVRLEGHSDGAGSRELNQWLSVERARAARMYLGELGVDISRVQAAGFGAERPLSSCNEPSCPMNRRVEIRFEETP